MVACTNISETTLDSRGPPAGASPRCGAGHESGRTRTDADPSPFVCECPSRETRRIRRVSPNFPAARASLRAPRHAQSDPLATFVTCRRPTLPDVTAGDVRPAAAFIPGVRTHAWLGVGMPQLRIWHTDTDSRDSTRAHQRRPAGGHLPLAQHPPRLPFARRPATSPTPRSHTPRPAPRARTLAPRSGGKAILRDRQPNPPCAAARKRARRSHAPPSPSSPPMPARLAVYRRSRGRASMPPFGCRWATRLARRP